MVDISDYISGNYLSAKDVKELKEPIARFIDEGIINEDTPFKRPVFEITIELSNGVVKTYGMNKTSVKTISEAYGEDSKNWKGKLIKLELVKQNVRKELKEVVYAEPYSKE